MAESSNEADGTLKKETVDSIIAEICASTQSVDIKNCVQCYEYGKSIKQIKAELNRFKKAQLQATYDHLKWPHEFMPNTKDLLVNDIVCRIQNYLPETCEHCNQSYCTKMGDVHLLACSVCGQEAHLPCLLSRLGLESADRLSAQEVANMINPMGWNNLQYICGPCGVVTIPSFSDNKTTPSQALDDEHSDAESVHNEQTINERNDVPNETTLCKFYHQGICKHGKKGTGCKYSHPTMCSKLLKHGIKPGVGCNLDKCQNNLHHPVMCKSSLHRGFCYKKVCKKYHVKGTKRVPDRKRTPKQPGSKENSANKRNPKKHPADKENAAPKSNDFLEMVEKLKGDMINQMESRIYSLLFPSLPAAPPNLYSSILSQHLLPHQRVGTQS